MNRLTNVVWKTNGGTIASFYYQLGLSGNRTNLSESVNGTSRTYGWTYDSLYQLKQETSELDTPTNARRVPTKNDLALGQLLTYERLSSEGKLGYSNSTPKRLARLVALSRLTREGLGRLFHSVPSDPNFGNGCDWPNYIESFLTQ